MSKYNPEGLTVRSADEIQEALVNHPDNHNRREDLNLLCDWRRSYERHMNLRGSEAMKAFLQKMRGEVSPSMRALTLLAEKDGDDSTIYHAKVDKYAAFKHILEKTPQEKRIDLGAAYKKSLESQIVLPDASELLPDVHPGMEKLCRAYSRAGVAVARLLRDGEEAPKPVPAPSPVPSGYKLN